MLLLWLSLFKANTVEELKKIEKLEVPVMNQAINAYYNITAESEFRESARLREKAGHDEASALRHAHDKGLKTGKLDIARNALTEGASLDFIQKITGLSIEEIEKL